MHAIDARTPTLARVPAVAAVAAVAAVEWWVPRYAERVIINVRGCRAVVSCSLVVVEKDEGVKLAR